MAMKTTRWDSAEYLKTDEDIQLYLEACIEEAGDGPREKHEPPGARHRIDSGRLIQGPFSGRKSYIYYRGESRQGARLTNHDTKCS